MEWSNATEAVNKAVSISTLKYEYDIASEVLGIPSLVVKANVLRNFMAYRHGGPMIAWDLAPQLEFNSDNTPDKQWLWEVPSWFEMALLTVKFSLLVGVQGNKENSTQSSKTFGNTSWICDKLLFLDDDPTNINFIGLMATLTGLLVIHLVSIMRIILVWIKQGSEICWKICRWVGAALRKRWKDLLHDLASAYTWIQGEFDLAAEGAR